MAVACRRDASSGDILNVVLIGVAWLLSAAPPVSVPVDMLWADCATDARFWPSCNGAPSRTSSAFDIVPAFVLFRLFFFSFGAPSSPAPFTAGFFFLDPSDFRGFFAGAGSIGSAAGGAGGGAGLKYSYVSDTVLCIGVCVYETVIALLRRRKDIVRKPRQSNAGRAVHGRLASRVEKKCDTTGFRAEKLTSARGIRLL